MGEMGEAEDESVQLMPEVAARIREERLKLEKDVYIYRPNFVKLMYYVAETALLPEVLDERGGYLPCVSEAKEQSNEQ